MCVVPRLLLPTLAALALAWAPAPTRAEPPTLNLHQLASRTRPAVALLTVTRSASARTCTGTGFFVTSDGKMITNWHVVRDAAQIRVQTSQGRRWPARVLAEDPEYDVALLQIDGPGEFTALDLDPADLAAEGCAIALVSNASVQEEKGLRPGIVAAIQRIFGKLMIQISTPLQPGLSGSPLVNAAGQVIGVANGQFLGRTDEEHVNFAVPVAPVRKLLNQARAMTPQAPPAATTTAKLEAWE